MEEPHEWVERAAHHHHEQAATVQGKERAGHSHSIAPAVTAAVLAVMAACAGLMSEHAATKAILLRNRANDQWAYFQSKSTKGHIYEVADQLVAALLPESGTAQERARKAQERFGKQVAKYNQEKEKTQHEAEELDSESDREFEQHHSMAQGVAAFQVGIVLASISVIVRSRTLHYLSWASGVIGLVFIASAFVPGLLRPLVG